MSYRVPNLKVTIYLPHTYPISVYRILTSFYFLVLYTYTRMIDTRVEC